MEEKTATIQWSTNVVDPMAGMDFGPDIGEIKPGMNVPWNRSTWTTGIDMVSWVVLSPRELR